MLGHIERRATPSAVKSAASRRVDRGRLPGSLPPLAGAAGSAFATAAAGAAGLGPTQPPCDSSNRLLDQSHAIRWSCRAIPFNRDLI